MERQLQLVTIFSHIATLFQQGYDVDLKPFLSESEYTRVHQAIVETGCTSAMKPIFEHLDGQIDYFKIRLALARFNKEAATV